MTSNASYELRRRSFEVIRFYKFIAKYDTEPNNDSDIIKILKANCFIMLYNMVESVTSLAFEELYQEISEHSFDELKQEIKVQVIKNIKLWEASKLVVEFNAIANQIALASFRKSEMFSGNLDARKIRETITSYKIPKHSTYEEEKLLTIKSNRNDLSHGDKSFIDCGKDYTIPDIEEHIIKCILFLRKMLFDIDKYIKTRGFKI